MPIEDLDYLYQNCNQENVIVLIDSKKRNKVVWPYANEFQIDFADPFKFIYGVEILDVSLPRTMYSIEKHNDNFLFHIGHVDDINQLFDPSTYQSFKAENKDYNINELVDELNLDSKPLIQASIVTDVESGFVNQNRKSVLHFRNTENPPRPFVFDCKHSSMNEIMGFSSVAQSSDTDLYLKILHKENEFLYASRPVNIANFENIIVEQNILHTVDYLRFYLDTSLLPVDEELINAEENADLTDYEPKIYSDLSALHSSELNPTDSVFISKIKLENTSTHPFVIYQVVFNNPDGSATVEDTRGTLLKRTNNFLQKAGEFITDNTQFSIQALSEYTNEQNINVVTSIGNYSQFRNNKFDHQSQNIDLIDESILLELSRPNCMYYIYSENIKYLTEFTFKIASASTDKVIVSTITDLNNQISGNVFKMDIVSRIIGSSVIADSYLRMMYLRVSIPFSIYEIDLSQDKNTTSVNSRAAFYTSVLRSALNDHNMLNLEEINTLLEEDSSKPPKNILINTSAQSSLTNPRFVHNTNFDINTFTFVIDTTDTSSIFKLVPIKAKGNVMHLIYSAALKNSTRITYDTQKIDSFEMQSPGIVQLLGERYAMIHCENIENHLRGSFMFNDYSPGLAIINLGVQGYSQNKTEFFNVKFKEFHPIGKLNNLKFVVKTDKGLLYDFKNVDWHMLISIKFYVPKNKNCFTTSLLNPNYQSNFIAYETEQAQLREQDAYGLEDTDEPDTVNEIQFRNEYLRREQELISSLNPDFYERDTVIAELPVGTTLNEVDTSGESDEDEGEDSDSEEDEEEDADSDSD